VPKRIFVAVVFLAVLEPTPVLGQQADPPADASHNLLMTDLGGGWVLSGMGQAYPIYSWGAGGFSGTPLAAGTFYLTQVVGMAVLTSPGGTLTVRVTPNLEGFTIRDGEITPGGWGEGFLDKRHPHTIMHEAVVSMNLPQRGMSISFGKGFAPYGTPDPMSRPGVKYPSNHHLSQIAERWFVSGMWLRGEWGLEAGVFGGTEPGGPFDFSNITSFGDSWAGRVSRRFVGSGVELSASFARVLEPKEPQLDLVGLPQDDIHPRSRSRLFSVAALQATDLAGGNLAWMVEASTDRHPAQSSFWSFLAEGAFSKGIHRSYFRVEYASRPEFARFGTAGTKEFFRYGFEDEAIGGNRWLTATMGYGGAFPLRRVIIGPFVEAQVGHIWEGFGGFPPESLYGTDGGWILSTGFRIYLGGEPMRMGQYGLLDSTSRYVTQLRRGSGDE